MLLVDCDYFKLFIDQFGLRSFMKKLIARLEFDYLRWDQFIKSPRHAVNVPEGVMELMPCSDGKFYTFKYVNGHPGNTAIGKLNIVGFGVLVEVSTGIPRMMSEMTWLTAIRTACMSALVIKHGARKSENIGIVGCGSQSEFQMIAANLVSDLKIINFYDKDQKAMEKFAFNLKNLGFELKPCASASEVCQNSDVLITNIGYKGRVSLLEVNDLLPGQLIIAIGGDCPGKTELSPDVLHSVDSIWVEYLRQTQIEGEIQQWQDAPAIEFHNIIANGASLTASDIVLFDGVGFALEDFSALSLLYDEIIKTNPSIEHKISPDLVDPKDLFGALHA